MMLAKYLCSLVMVLAVIVSAAESGDEIVVVRFDCQGGMSWLSEPLADSLEANLRTLRVPRVSRSRWENTLAAGGYSESDINYNPPVLARLAQDLGAAGAVYGQVFQKNGLLIMDSYYIEAGETKPVDIDPMVGYVAGDLLEMTWDLALIISRPDKRPPAIVRVEPQDSTLVNQEYAEFKLFFDEPMNPDSYGLTGEPEDMFFSFGEVEYDPQEYSFKFNVHLYPGREYKFWVNGPSLKPFMDTTGNVAGSYQWRVITR